MFARVAACTNSGLAILEASFTISNEVSIKPIYVLPGMTIAARLSSCIATTKTVEIKYLAMPRYREPVCTCCFQRRPPSPLSVRYFSARSASFHGYDDGEGLKLELPLAQSAFSPLRSADWLKIAVSIALAAAIRS